jgi:tRNA1Val (adenine37-N6)-methyltransferase
MKTRSHFQFRQFAVADDQCSMKVGTDAVLLAAWVRYNHARNVLDIGTGSGVMALIAAQRTSPECMIDGVEIQDADAVQASANAAASRWSSRIRIVHAAVQDYRPPERYDIILCNPPYFINSLLPPNTGRTVARHATTLDHATLLKAIGRLLAKDGTAHVVMPAAEGGQFIGHLEIHGFHCSRKYLFRTRAGKDVERLLIAFGQAPLPCEHGEILLYDDTGNAWTEGYKALTGDLYLPR